MSKYPENSPWTVLLSIPIDSADSPDEAVEAFINELNTWGVRGYLYRAICEETAETWYVQEGETYSLAEAIEQFGSKDEDEDEDEDEDVEDVDEVADIADYDEPADLP